VRPARINTSNIVDTINKEDAMERSRLPVVVIGAGPVGLAAAAHLIGRGEQPVVLEAGETVGDAVLRWGHVKLFSPWSYVVDRASALLLERAGWSPPAASDFPTGRELVERYLRPLADTAEIRRGLRLGARVLYVTRSGLDKMKTEGREALPFAVRVRSSGGEETILARAVIDASGTTQSPNPLGAGGVFASGESALAGRISYGLPDVRGSRYLAKKVLVVGSGHSAFNVLLDLAQRQEPGAETLWAIRRAQPGNLFGGGKKDGLAERGRLGARMRAAVESGRVRMLTGFAIASLAHGAEGVEVLAADGRRLVVDEVVASTGFRPDLEMTRELRLSLDSIVESPSALAPLIDPNVHSCGSVPPHGARELAHPEKDYFVVGMKSYGRAPTFLMLTGYEQVRSIVAQLTGDHEAASKVELVLPETGVCSTDNGGSCAVDAPATSCCTTKPAQARGVA
jgi:cation diffusion facilitator CzcD-associated flavoprotein CzcO